MMRLFKIGRRGGARMSGRHIALAIPLCCAFYPSALFAVSSDGLLMGIMFAKNEVENATGEERDGVVNLCKEAFASADTVRFWSDLEKDCKNFVEMSLVETFGSSISTSCLGELGIPEILEVSSDTGRDYTIEETSDSIGRTLAFAAVVVAEQTQSPSSSSCIDALKAISARQ